MGEILWCDLSNETSSAVLSHDTIWFSVFSLILGIDESQGLNDRYITSNLASLTSFVVLSGDK